MSPLQRCCEIRTLVWPIVVCLSVRVIPTPSKVEPRNETASSDSHYPASVSGGEFKQTVSTSKNGDSNQKYSSSSHTYTAIASKRNETSPSDFGQTSAYAIEATDGWWWCPAMLDPSLIELVRMGKIRDGTKVIIFAATFICENEEFSKCQIRVRCNAVRRAHDSAPFGFVQPRRLHRGLSVKTIRIEGGVV